MGILPMCPVGVSPMLFFCFLFFVIPAKAGCRGCGVCNHAIAKRGCKHRNHGTQTDLQNFYYQSTNQPVN